MKKKNNNVFNLIPNSESVFIFKSVAKVNVLGTTTLGLTNYVLILFVLFNPMPYSAHIGSSLHHFNLLSNHL